MNEEDFNTIVRLDSFVEATVHDFDRNADCSIDYDSMIVDILCSTRDKLKRMEGYFTNFGDDSGWEFRFGLKGEGIKHGPVDFDFIRELRSI